MKPPVRPALKDTSSFSRFVHSPITLGVFIGITLYTSTIAYSQWKKERIWNARVVAKEIEIEAMRAQHDTLKARVAYAESEAGKEEYVRQSFDVAQKGESLIILPEAEKTPPSAKEEVLPEKKSWWQNLMAKMFNL